MLTAVFASLLVITAVFDGDPSKKEARELLDAIEALQQPIRDFRCEFEGSNRYMGNLAESQKGFLGVDGTSDTYSGIFLWRRGGDTHVDTLSRMAFNNIINRDLVAIRPTQGQVEQYHRGHDQAMGDTQIKSFKESTDWPQNSYHLIFLIERMKKDVANGDVGASVSDEVVAGRPLKTLTLSLRGVPGVPDFWLARYWIDLARSGHVVRVATYLRDKVVSTETKIELQSFKIDNQEVWMPTRGVTTGHIAMVDNLPTRAKDPTAIQTVYLVGGTMEFNKGLGPEAFRVDYKLGTPISDGLKKLNFEYGQQKIGSKPTIAEAERMLKEQVAKAEAQEDELVVATRLGGFDWWPWVVGGLVIAVLGSLVALGLQRRRH